MTLLVVFCVSFIFLVASAQAQQPQQQKSLNCSDTDFVSLRTFVEHLAAPPQGWNLNPSSPDCCNWEGIGCVSGRVATLELGRRRLRGNMSEALGNLDHLRILNISGNNFQGSIPQSILHLQKLEILDLSYTGISGIFPDTADLPSIRLLDVSGNSITGSAPVMICRNSSKIASLNLADNNFSGTLPPGLGNCSSLNELILAYNRFSGDLPADIFSLKNLSKLDLQENQFSGELSRIGNLSKLTYLDLSMNFFTGSLPNVFDRLNGLQYFSAQSNNFTGTIPGSLSNSPTITTLTLRNNSLTGKIELNCSAMVSLASLNLATNPFYGEIPAYLPNCRKLRSINFARINFSGRIPDSFKNFQSLASFSLSNSSISNISSALDILQHCKNLTTLVLSLNFQNEAMPNDLNLQFDSLRILVVANCRLTGEIPQWLRSCKNLQLLDFSWNRLDGLIPVWFGSLPSLFYLDLSNNTLTGDIPIELTQMRSFNDGVNVSMESLDIPFFVRMNRSEYKYKQVVSFKPTLELGNNRLTGKIWPEFGNLKELHVLDLKRNELTGSIPATLSGMRSLETLDLSYNGLTGSIPDSLTKLSFLSTFNVAHNNLSGPIPSGGQFLTFNASSFDGNPGLCCDHNFRPCSTGDDPRTSFRESEKAKGAIIGMGVGIGIGTVFIFAVVYLLILCSCSRRVSDQVREDEDGDIGVSDMDDTTSLVIVCQSSIDDNKQIFLNDLLKSTENFDQSKIIGCGGFGLVYRAELSDGRKVAIKRLSGEYFQMEREFQAEIETLSRALHPNLVHLQGYCKYKNDRLLIYTYMEHGSLDYWLHEKIDGPPSLDWATRLKIAQGSARGLAYLHLSCEPHILHRDIKSSNILLNENFDAHLADFGLARLILPYDTHVTTDLVGTLGYIPPEYSQASVATYKGDIYSFGVVLLELLTGKRPMDMCRPKGFRDLISWVHQMRVEKKETEVFDPFIYDKEHAREMLIVLEIACLCLNENPRVRPGIDQLVTWLDNIDSLPKLESG